MKCHKCDIFYHCFFCVFTLDISISILILDNNLVSKHLTKVFEQKSFSSSELSQLSGPGVSVVSLVCGRGTLSSMDWAPAGPGDLMDLWGNHCHHWLATADCTHCTSEHYSLYKVFTPIGAGGFEDYIKSLSIMWQYVQGNDYTSATSLLKFCER